MNDTLVRTTQFCVVHGYAHPRNEFASDPTLISPDHLRCREVEWPNVVALYSDEVSELSQRKLKGKVPTFDLRAGDLAYYDTFGGGLVPVKVFSITRTETLVLVTADRMGFRRGEGLTLSANNQWLIHRKQVHRKRGQYRVTGQARFITDDGGFQ